jgi:hypothetical protein
MEISTKKYFYYDMQNEQINKTNKNDCIIEIYNGNCFDASNLYIDSVIHNFANNTRPGGPTNKFNEYGLLESYKKIFKYARGSNYTKIST